MGRVMAQVTPCIMVMVTIIIGMLLSLGHLSIIDHDLEYEDNKINSRYSCLLVRKRLFDEFDL